MIATGPGAAPDALDEAVARILEGGVDLHVHTAPSPMPRRIDVVAAARSADAAGMRAIVVKSHHHSTVTDVLALRDHGLRDLAIQVYGGVALNSAVGGLNPHAVDLALKMGGRVVWFPTIASPRHIAEHHAHPDLKFPKLSFTLLPEAPAEVVDDEGRVRPAVREIIALIRDADAILATGHLAPPAITAVLAAAREAGVRRLLVNHPTFVVGATPADARGWVELGAVIEHSICIYDDRSTFYQREVDELVAWLRAVGPAHTCLGSDLGQVDNPLPVEGYTRILRTLLRAGVGEAELKAVVCTTPARVLGV
jgi:hypothetical protein